MQRATLQRLIAAAKRRVDAGELRLTRQRVIIDRLRVMERDSSDAETLLVEFEKQQTIFRADLDWFLGMLSPIA